ncbi:hypothetical protein H2200_003954 [Cladophialophora chaetospira]|uniref:F-box domain-containing protein n=1 Tax=Cladophialophora chaetospira TaxID=386627 RepID=A0AA38XFD3_9EURO|nr:hypothetical protein H2200_003954 [Cladophialophora chaetospira]
MADTNIPGFSPPTAPELTDMPLEIIGNIIARLGREDLRSCRQVRALNSEATRALFRTIHIRAEDWLSRAGSVITEPALSVHVRAVVFSEELREATIMKRGYRAYNTNSFAENLKDLILNSRHLYLTSIELESLDLKCLSTLFNASERVPEFLQKAERFHLLLHPGRTLDDWKDYNFHSTMLPDFEDLSSRLPALQDLTLGFSRKALLDMDEGLILQNRVGKAMLQGFYPRLASLTLQKLVVWDGTALEAFLDRHRATLKSLTIKDIYLIGSGERANREICLFKIFRLLSLFKNATQLEHMSFEGEIRARFWTTGDIHTAMDVSISCRDMPLGPQALLSPIRSEVEAYICHERETLPFVTVFRQMNRTLQEAFNRTRHILCEDYDELIHDETLYLKSDYTWEFKTWGRGGREGWSVI